MIMLVVSILGVGRRTGFFVGSVLGRGCAGGFAYTTGAIAAADLMRGRRTLVARADFS